MAFKVQEVFQILNNQGKKSTHYSSAPCSNRTTHLPTKRAYGKHGIDPGKRKPQSQKPKQISNNWKLF